MNRYCFLIMVLCLSVFLSGCNTIEESTISSELYANISESTEVSETCSTSSESTSSTSSETEVSVTYESVSIPEGLTREEIYEDVGHDLLILWSMYFYIDNESHVYLREYADFDETMMLEMLYTSYLYTTSNQYSSIPRTFDYCHIDDNEDSLLYTIQAMHFLFGQEISAEEIMTLVPGTEEDSYVMRYDEDYASLRLEFCDISEAEVEITDTNVAEDNYDFKTECSILSSDDTSCTYYVYWTPGSYGEHLPNGRFAPVRDIATITVTFDFDDSYDLGFIITDIQVERAP